MRQETEDQKALRIARQSQMERALEYHTLMGYKPTSRDLIMTAEMFTKYIMDGWSSKGKKDHSLEWMLEMLDSKLNENYRGE